MSESHPINYDYTLFCDGSGYILEKGAGWAGILYDIRTRTAKPLIGGYNVGTNNLAEIMTTIQALYYLGTVDASLTRILKHINDTEEILIYSDSEWFVRIMSGEYECTNVAPLYWFVQLIKNIAKNCRFNLTFKHVRRNSNEFNAWCDEVAGTIRKNLQSLELPRLPNFDGISSLLSKTDIDAIKTL